MERILVFGDRKWTDGDRIFERLNQVNMQSGIECFIDGGDTSGAEALGRIVAENLGFQILKLPKRIQDLHGPDKNEEMLRIGDRTRSCGHRLPSISLSTLSLRLHQCA